MGTRAAPPQSSQRSIDPALRLGAAQLAVSDLARSVDFYKRVLGLELLDGDERNAQLGVAGARPLLALGGLEHPAAAAARSTGLFHLAWLHPTRSALAASLERVVRADWPVHGASDHGVSEALYLSDPDGLGIELYADRPRELWRRMPGDAGLEMVTLPLDVDDLLAQAPLQPAPRIDPATTLGHVHLKVSDLARAVSFYRDALGFELQAELPSAAFLSAGGYHHHVALNTWQSAGAGPPPESAPGIRLVTLELSAGEELDALARRLQERQPSATVRQLPGRLEVGDPDGVRLAFTALAGA